MYKKYFTQTEREQAIQQYNSGMTLWQVADYWKAARGTMWNRLKSWGVTFRPACKVANPKGPKGRPLRFTPEQHKEMVYLYTELNKTVEELAIIYSSNRTTIRKWLKQANVVMRKPGRRGRELISPDMIQQIASEKASGMTWKELGKHYGYCYKYLSATCKETADQLRSLL